ncbi:MAG: arylmalonate decarboxylase [Dehalococcoidia bacterium]|nr:arylmalonate decarboxylase [Dehalococcoidia bacterium]
MPDVLGYRAKFGVLGPSTNTIVEPEYYMMAPPGVTLHYGRIYIKDQRLGNDEQFEALLNQIRESIQQTVREVLTAEPDYLIMGMSAETFWGGKQGNDEFTARLRAWSGLRISTGADACRRALEVFGARRLGVITPYQPVGDSQVRKFFSEVGYDIVALEGLKCPSAVAIAQVTAERLRTAIMNVNRPDVDAIVQVGTNLSMVRLADEAERWLRKPVIAINAATFWHALRENGITDQMKGFGTLLREY